VVLDAAAVAAASTTTATATAFEFYCTMHVVLARYCYRKSIRPSVTLSYHEHVG